MTFQEPRWLAALLLLPAFAMLEWWAAARSERALAALVGRRTPHPLLAQRRPGFRRYGALLRLAAFACLAIGAAEPEWGRELVRRTATGSDVVLLVDVSASMDARDVAPSRLHETRREALAVIDRLQGSRIGVVAFSGDAVRLCPLTQDASAARLVVESLWSGSVSEPGTDLGRGLALARKVLPTGRRDEQAIVLWTDGEDLERGAAAALADVAASGIRVFTVGVGTPAGDVVPSLDDQGRAVDVKRDEAGNAVRSRLDERLLRDVARRTRGAYFSASRPGGELPRLLSALGTLARSGRGERLVERPVARFPLFASLAALCLALEALRPRRRLTEDERATARPARARGRAVAVAAALALLALLAAFASPARAQSNWAKGDRAFRDGRFADAETLYAQRARGKSPLAVRVNLATARALNGKAAQALGELEPVLGVDGREGDAARYNTGTVLGEQRQYREAMERLRATLERNPGDADARWNYEVALRRLIEEERRRREQQPQSGGSSPQPSPSQPQSSSGGGSQPQPQPGPQPKPRPGTPPPNAPPQGGSGEMSKSQADQILNALQDLTRADEQRQRRVRVLRERRGKDW